VIFFHDLIPNTSNVLQPEMQVKITSFLRYDTAVLREILIVTYFKANIWTTLNWTTSTAFQIHFNPLGFFTNHPTIRHVVI
jgi:hypothetical protein